MFHFRSLWMNDIQDARVWASFFGGASGLIVVLDCDQSTVGRFHSELDAVYDCVPAGIPILHIARTTDASSTAPMVSRENCTWKIRLYHHSDSFIPFLMKTCRLCNQKIWRLWNSKFGAEPLTSTPTLTPKLNAQTLVRMVEISHPLLLDIKRAGSLRNRLLLASVHLQRPDGNRGLLEVGNELARQKHVPVMNGCAKSSKEQE